MHVRRLLDSFDSRGPLKCVALPCRHAAPPLLWDCDVAASAQAWADLGKFDHSQSYIIPPPAGPAGENLAMGQATGTAATDAWYSEVGNWMFDPGDGTQSKGTTGHFTAMIWKGAKKLGCGHYPSSKIWVCRYKAGDTLSADTPNMAGAAGPTAMRCGPSRSQLSPLVTLIPPGGAIFAALTGPVFPGSYKANVLPLGSRTKAECGVTAAASESLACALVGPCCSALPSCVAPLPCCCSIPPGRRAVPRRGSSEPRRAVLQAIRAAVFGGQAGLPMRRAALLRSASPALEPGSASPPRC
jgi:hypothetical protein